ncbi:MAG: lantibiotic dehydratase C-terminal domain-containing protein [Acidobacteriota bacterium]
MRAADGVNVDAPPTDADPSDAGPPFGIPTASANLYCHGQLHAALTDVVVPVWRWVRAEGAGRAALWFMRYSRGGAHIKLRLHAPPALTASFKVELERTAAAFFAQIPASDPARPKDVDDRIPAIDAEDAVAEPHPDRTLLWTAYPCPPSHLGTEPLSGAPGFARTHTAALAAMTDVVLARIDAETQASGLGMSLLANFLFTMASMPDQDGVRALAHHRDWLLGGAQTDAAAALRFMDQKIAANPGQRDALRQQWFATAQQDAPLPEFAPFSRALRAHVDLSLDALGASRTADLNDPEAAQLFGAVARIQHKVANLLAIDLSNEIYLCHLVHRAASPADA